MPQSAGQQIMSGECKTCCTRKNEEDAYFSSHRLWLVQEMVTVVHKTVAVVQSQDAMLMQQKQKKHS